MSDEFQLQVQPREQSSSLSRLTVGSGLIARGRRDAEAIARQASEPVDPLSETRRRAEEGNPYWQETLGEAYEDGNGVPQDFASAAMWYRKAAEQGFGPAQQRLGRLYRDGRGVPQDFAQALEWYAKAATASPYGGGAKFELGRSYYDGIGVTQNYGEAVKWSREATKEPRDFMGYAPLYLGYAYANGHGVPQDFAGRSAGGRSRLTAKN